LTSGSRPPVPVPVPADLEAADPGLARARTRLAWRRSSVSFAAIGLVILKSRPLIALPVLILSVAIWSIGRLPRTLGGAGAAPRRVLLVTLSVILVALAALAIALAGHASRGLQL
jgi:hypothetical protein